MNFSMSRTDTLSSMAKRQKDHQEEKRKKLKQLKDAQLSTGVFKTEVESEEDQGGDWDNEEQDYERKYRKQFPTSTIEGLPIKKMDGTIERVMIKAKKAEDDVPETTETEETKVEDKEDKPKQDEYSQLSPKERLVRFKEEIADLASKLIEDPEENISCLTKLRHMAESNNVVICQLAIMALIPVFKSLAPSYRIRPLTEAEKREKVSKDVARLRRFEQLLVHNYKAYIDRLAKLARTSFLNSQNNKKITSEDVKKGQLGAKAACELCLSSLRHFNYRADLFNIIIRRLNRKPTESTDLDIFTKCIRALEVLVKEDVDDGSITFDIIRLLCKSIRDKNFRVDESVINIFLSLSVLDDYDPNNNRDVPKRHIKKKDRVHLSKKEKKARKERKEIEEEMKKAEQAVTAEEREKNQAQVLKLTLTLYLEILRAGNQSLSDASLLTAAVLEGLAKFGQMANFDLLGDFLEVLREIMADIIAEHSLNQDDDDDDEDEEEAGGGMYSGPHIRTVLLCIATSFALVINHTSTGKLPMAVDFSNFISGLYVILADLCLDTDLEFSHKSLRLADPLSSVHQVEKPSVNVSTKAELLLRCLDFIFFKSRNGSLPRATAFTKRLYVTVLHAPEKTSLATLKFVGKLMSRYGEGFKGLWNTEERISGEGNYILGIESAKAEVNLERSNSGAATLWENVLLDKHYCPMVKDGSRSLFKNSKPSV